jgi:UDP-N-acetylmuramoyl-tripeptide--D-alanyl-D-alanine ligase
MKLSKDFLYTALPGASFQFANKDLTVQDSLWAVLEKKGEVLVSIDSRTIQPGELFIALKGPSFDGHDFVADALSKGACGALIDQSRTDVLKKINPDVCAHAFFIKSTNALDAFIALAKAWRQRLTCPVVGITGSVGKTSTKEMLKTILTAAGVDAYASYKNYNNVFGMCYNILRIPEKTAVAVLEVGINEVGEMRQLVDILRPSIGLVTCVAHAHLEGLGNSLNIVAQEKRQLFSFFTPQDIGIVNGDQSLLSDVCYAHPIAKFGLKTKNQIQARRVQFLYHENGTVSTSFFLKWYGQKASIQLQGNHTGFVYNALAASALAYFLHIPFDAVVKGLHAYQGVERRFELKKLKDGRGTLLSDCYNANPESMKAALIAFSRFKTTGPKIVVLGDMLELGKREAYWHRQIGRVICKEAPINTLILVGERARMIGKMLPLQMPIEFAQDWQEAQKMLELHLAQKDSLVLVKASHGMRLDKMVDAVVE